MAADYPISFPSAAAATPRASAQPFAAKALQLSVRLWFGATLLGQLLFAFTIASFYGMTAMRGDWQSWNRFMFRGHAAGATMGNTAVAIHLAAAVLMILAGASQFVPRIRNRFPKVHRVSGRVYTLAVLALSGAGVYMHWFNGTFGDASLHLGGTINAVLIWIFAFFAIRAAIARDFKTHRRWTIRLFLVANGAWFFRVLFFLTMMIFQRPVGFDPNTFTGPFITFNTYSTYLVPLLIAELYFAAQERPGAALRMATASLLVLLTLGTVGGVTGIAAMTWVPSIKAAFDSRKGLAQELAVTIQTSGIDAAVARYRTLKATEPGVWNFNRSQLNTLGYQLIRSGHTKEAIRIFQLNVEAYPRHANAYDSLAEGYWVDGQTARAIENYRKSVQLDPENYNGIAALKKLGAM